MSSKGEEFGSVSLRAEEIAAVLADTYYDADLIRQDSGRTLRQNARGRSAVPADDSG